jgi:hypothetical protein
MNEKHSQEEKWLFGFGMHLMVEYFTNANRAGITAAEAIQQIDSWVANTLHDWTYSKDDAEFAGQRKYQDLILPPKPQGLPGGA